MAESRFLRRSFSDFSILGVNSFIGSPIQVAQLEALFWFPPSVLGNNLSPCANVGIKFPIAYFVLSDAYCEPLAPVVVMPAICKKGANKADAPFNSCGLSEKG